MEKKRFHYAYAIVASCIAITCLPCALVLSCAGIFFTPVSEFFGVPKASFTLYFSVLNIMMMLTLPLAGNHLSRLDARKVLSGATILAGVGLIGMSFGTSMPWFYVCGAVLGFGMAPLIYMAVPTLINNWCVKKVGFFVGLCMAFTGIGGVIFNPIGTAIIQSGPEGWRLAYRVFGLIVLIGTLPFTLFVVRSKPEDKGLLPYG
ncbi:MAG: MFS transporter, partial [Atopobiaceae bacterium]|nr:MFS transporter [Atopobiaceae bacterium]